MTGVRESTVVGIKHPDPLRVSDSGRVLTLIVDPVADVIGKGDPTLLWEGDDRLAMYFDPQARTYELWRLEANNEYQCFKRLAADVFRGPEAVVELILSFKAHDSRRGFDPYKAVVEQAARVELAREKAATAHNEEFAERLRFALIKDGVS